MLAKCVSDWTAVSNENHGVWGKVTKLPLPLKHEPRFGHAVPTVRTFSYRLSSNVTVDFSLHCKKCLKYLFFVFFYQKLFSLRKQGIISNAIYLIV